MSDSAKTMVTADSSNIRTLPVDQQPTPMQMMQIMIERGTDPDQLEKMLNLQERWEANQARKEFAKAMSDFQARCPRITNSGRATVKMRSGGQYQYSFAPLDQILQTIQPHLEATGLSVTFSSFKIEGSLLTLSCIVQHEGGHTEEYPFAVPVDESLQINKMQQIGVANSYCKRYALCNALNLVGTDNDTDGHVAEPPKVEYINDKQLITIRDHLDSLNVNEETFCDFLRDAGGLPSVDRLEHLPKRGFNVAMNAIKAKQAKAAKEKPE